jgi:(p)ppGpp synthase/HD superfamily hydrolase
LVKLLKKYHKSTLVDWGKYILNTALEEQSGKEFGLLPEKTQKFILNKFSAYDHDQLYYFLATQKIELTSVLGEIKNILDISDFSREVSFKIFVKT